MASTAKSSRIAKIICSAVLLCIIFSVALYNPMENRHSAKIADYSKWENSTKRILSESFSDSLPSNEAASQYGQSYYYKSAKALFGDKQFVIMVTLKFDDTASYEKELAKYKDADSHPTISDGTMYYALQYSEAFASEYLNDEIDDGVYYDFEIVSANNNDLTIRYVNAHVWDYYSDHMLVQYLQEM